jgi:hypothetical protein
MLEGVEVLRGRLTHSQILIVSESMPSTRSIPAIRTLGVVGFRQQICSDLLVGGGRIAFDDEAGCWSGGFLLMVYNRIKLQVDMQADKSLVVVKGPFFPRVVNPRYRICGTMRDARVDLVIEGECPIFR